MPEIQVEVRIKMGTAYARSFDLAFVDDEDHAPERLLELAATVCSRAYAGLGLDGFDEAAQHLIDMEREER